MISLISIISALVAFVYLGVLGVKDLPESVQVESAATSTLNVAGYVLAFLVPMFLIVFGFLF